MASHSPSEARLASTCFLQGGIKHIAYSMSRRKALDILKTFTSLAIRLMKVDSLAFGNMRIRNVLIWRKIGGNDYEIYEDPRTVGHAVTSPEDTIAELKSMFNL